MRTKKNGMYADIPMQYLDVADRLLIGLVKKAWLIKISQGVHGFLRRARDRSFYSCPSVRVGLGSASVITYYTRRFYHWLQEVWWNLRMNTCFRLMNINQENPSNSKYFSNFLDAISMMDSREFWTRKVIHCRTRCPKRLPSWHRMWSLPRVLWD